MGIAVRRAVEPDLQLSALALDSMGQKRETETASRSGGQFVKRHSLSLTAAGLVITWVLLYAGADPRTHLGSFFGNAVADWTGVVVTVVATKYLYETGATGKRHPGSPSQSRLRELVHNHTLTIFLLLTGIAWVILYENMDSETKWGQVVGNIVSEWTQILGLVLMTKRLIERKSSHRQ